MKRQQYPPIVWLSAGIGITLMLIALVAAIVLPNLLMEEDTLAVASLTTKVEAIVSVVAPTAIPTFTPSLTLPPSATPTASLTPTPTPTPSRPPTETPTSTPTITPTPPPQLLAELDTRLFLGPARDYPEQGWLTAGSRALILGRLEGDEWWYVETQLGIKGWVQAGAGQSG